MNLQRIRGEALGRLKRKPKERWGVTTVLALLAEIQKTRDRALEDAARVVDTATPREWVDLGMSVYAARIRALKSKKEAAS